MENKVMVAEFVTPPTTTVGITHLKTPNMDLAERFPVEFETESGVINLNKRYQIRVGFNTNDESHVGFIDTISSFEGDLQERASTVYSLFRAKRIKTKEGNWIEDPNIPTMLFTKQADGGSIPVLEKGLPVEGDRLILDSGTVVKIHFDMFEKVNEEKDTAQLKIVPRLVEILKRPERKSMFKNKKLKPK